MKIKESRLERTAFTPKELLQDSSKKIIFIGRSNVGKSSLINKILGRKNLARTSSTPGKTLSVNYYNVKHIVDGEDEEFLFVDLPGYGYARTSRTEIQRVKNLITAFFNTVKNARLVVLLVDSRRGFMDSDIEFISQIQDKNFKLLTVLTKSDKLRHSELLCQKKDLQHKFDLSVISFTIKSNDKKEEMLKLLNNALME
jgi:GTP-binding protein